MGLSGHMLVVRKRQEALTGRLTMVGLELIATQSWGMKLANLQTGLCPPGGPGAKEPPCACLPRAGSRAQAPNSQHPAIQLPTHNHPKRLLREFHTVEWG